MEGRGKGIVYSILVYVESMEKFARKDKFNHVTNVTTFTNIHIDDCTVIRHGAQSTKPESPFSATFLHQPTYIIRKLYMKMKSTIPLFSVYPNHTTGSRIEKLRPRSSFYRVFSRSPFRAYARGALAF